MFTEKKNDSIERMSLVDILNEKKTRYEQLFADNINAPDAEITVTVNTKKASKEAGGVGSLTFMVMKDGKKRRASASLYIMENSRGNIVMFVNNNTYDVIFKNMTEDSVDKAEKYVLQFIKRVAETDGRKPKNTAE